MKAQIAFVGARGIDSLPLSYNCTPDLAKKIRDSRIDFVCLYLGAVNVKTLNNIIEADLAFMPVSYAGAYENPDIFLRKLEELRLPKGITVWADLEGQSVYNAAPSRVIASIDDWGRKIADAGYIPGLYIGSPQPLTSSELWHINVTRYWRAPARIVDRNGMHAEPACGYCMSQMWPSVRWADTLVDVDIIGQDYHERVPVWAVKD